MKRSILLILLIFGEVHSQNSSKFAGIHVGELFNFGSSALFGNFALAQANFASNLFCSFSNKHEIEHLNQFRLAYSKALEDKIIGFTYSLNQENNWHKHSGNIGIQLNYSKRWFFAPSIDLQLTNYPRIKHSNEYNASASFGIAYQYNSNWNFGLHAFNLIASQQAYQSFKINPSIYYTYENNLLIGIQSEVSQAKSIINNRLHFLYTNKSGSAIYVQYSVEGNYFTLGYSKKMTKFGWNILLSYHDTLGYSPSIELNRFWHEK